jgi:hypothetical protein
MIQIALLEKPLEAAYDEFLLSQPETLIYASLKYRDLLTIFLGQQSAYFIAIDPAKGIIAALPSFVSLSQAYGAVLNSLPFYGSNGGIINSSGDANVNQMLLRRFYEFAHEMKCVASTIVTSPFQQDLSIYEEHSGSEFRDSRIGQITELVTDPSDVDNRLMAIFHSKTRNQIRKAQGGDIRVTTELFEGAMEFLSVTHCQNIVAVGGIPKPESFFRTVLAVLRYGRDVKIFTAINGGQAIAALLMLYFNKTAEYFTPAIVPEYRGSQAMSLLIFEAMKDAVRQEFRWWNWGGTWLSQGGVHHFKKRWGTKDLPYQYYTRIHDRRVLGLSKRVLLDEFPYFYVVPFDQLKGSPA